MNLEDLHYKIPKELIALKPIKPRDKSKLVIVGKKNRIIDFDKLTDELKPNDALILNNTKVIKAYLEGHTHGKKVSINLNKLENQKKNIWSAFIKTKKKIAEGDRIFFFESFYATIDSISCGENHKTFFLKFNISPTELKTKIDKFGYVPLPQYIQKRGVLNSDLVDYQTVFAEKEGAVAAPTASLHFTRKLLNKLKKIKIKIIKVTLHANGGTFLPIKSDDISKHSMHYENGFISKKAAEEINKVKKKGGRIIGVGTTVLRILESSKDKYGFIKPFKGETNIFIKPGWKINTVDGIITNFHTPKSTLLLIIFTLIGRLNALNLYKFAIKKKLRFFSYGDACLIWNKNE